LWWNNPLIRIKVILNLEWPEFGGNPLKRNLVGRNLPQIRIKPPTFINPGN